MLQRRLMETRSMYRSVRYRISRDKDTRTADPSSNFRIKKNSCIQSTMANTFNSHFPSINLTIDLTENKYETLTNRPTYLESFNSLMETSEQNINKRKIKINKRQCVSQDKPIQFFRESKEAFRIKDRIVIPEFQKKQKQVQLSEHHILAPFDTPFSHVKFMANNSRAQLNDQKQQVREIKAGLQNLKKNANKNLDDLTSEVQGQINKIRGILRKNQIEQQEKKLKTKREMEELLNYHAQNRNKFDQLHEKNSRLQVTIFNSTPYNLEVLTEETRGSKVVQDPEQAESYEQKLKKKIQAHESEFFEQKKLQMFYV